MPTTDKKSTIVSFRLSSAELSVVDRMNHIQGVCNSVALFARSATLAAACAKTDGGASMDTDDDNICRCLDVLSATLDRVAHALGVLVAVLQSRSFTANHLSTHMRPQE